MATDVEPRSILGMTGGVMSASRKRKLQEVVERDREAFEERERGKKYNGPVGKNPWGSIAQDWAGKPKKRDFADELLLFAKERGVGLAAPRKAKMRDVWSRVDWDDPDAEQADEEDDEVADPVSRALHKRTGLAQRLGQTVLEGEQSQRVAS